MSATRGKFFVFEGMDGCGKDSQIELVAQALREEGYEVLITREPGGTPVGEKLRDLCLHEVRDNTTQILLQFAARRLHCIDVIEPALKAGKVVLCNRYLPSTYAYQAFGADDFTKTKLIFDLMGETGVITPDQVFYFKVSAETAEKRRSGRSSSDQFESQDVAYFERVKEGYDWVANKFKVCMPTTVLDAEMSIEEVTTDLLSALKAFK